MVRLTYARLAAVSALVAVLLLAGCQPEGSLGATSLKVTVHESSLTIVGWALDQDSPTTPIDVHVYVDGNSLAVRADRFRPDVGVAKPGAGPNHGYQAKVQVSSGTHEVCTYAINAPGTEGANVKLGCRTVKVPPRPVKRPASAPTTTVPPTTDDGEATDGTGTPPTGGGTTPPAPIVWQDEMITAVNQARATTGAPDVGGCTALTTAAQSYAEEIAAAGWFDSTGPDGSDPWTRAEGYEGASIGENLAFGSDTPTKTTDVMLRSAVQSENLLLPEFTDIGVGRAPGDPATPGFYWVVVLGSDGSC